MSERLGERVRRAAERRAAERADGLARALAARLPAGVSSARTGAGVALSGRGLKRRFALDARLRAAIGRGE
jgi:hypothetical protein